MKKAYKTDYILSQLDAGTLQREAGVPAFVTSRLKAGTCKLTGATSAKIKRYYNRIVGKELKDVGMPLEVRQYHIRNFEREEIQPEKDRFLKIAETIYKNKLKKNPKIKLQNIIDGMTKSFRETAGDWIQYVKEMKYISAKQAKRL